jgi:hypothetical protein
MTTRQIRCFGDRTANLGPSRDVIVVLCQHLEIGSVQLWLGGPPPRITAGTAVPQKCVTPRFNLDNALVGKAAFRSRHDPFCFPIQPGEFPNNGRTAVSR